MNSTQIFVKRLIKAWKFQFGVFHTIADWTVMLYIIIPTTVILAMIYRSWWIEIPTWISFVPFILIFFILYILSWNGNIRTYVEEADKVFLVKKMGVYRGMKKQGYIYSVFFQFLSICFAFLVLLPFLVHQYEFNWQQIGALFLYFLSLKTGLMLIKYYVKRVESTFKRVSLSVLLFIIISWINQVVFLLWENSLHLWMVFFSLIILGISIIASLKTLMKISLIDHEININAQEKMKNIQIIFKMSNEIETPIISKRTKPLFFRRSKRIFKKRTPVNGFIELFIKMFIRNSTYVFGLLQIISITTGAMVIIPAIWLKVLILIAVFIMLNIWIPLVWDNIMKSNPQMKKYRENPAYITGKKRAVNGLFIVVILLLMALVTISFRIAFIFQL